MSEYALEDWYAAVARELGVPDAVGWERAAVVVLDLARDVAHGVERPAAPLTTFLLGVAVGRADDARGELDGLADQVKAMLGQS
ncbi:MAG: DUF6457 domain-containing protein [Acidimicrobiales bacterium]